LSALVVTLVTFSVKYSEIAKCRRIFEFIKIVIKIVGLIPLQAGLPIRLTPSFLRLRFSFCWPLCASINYILTY